MTKKEKQTLALGGILLLIGVIVAIFLKSRKKTPVKTTLPADVGGSSSNGEPKTGLNFPGDDTFMQQVWYNSGSSSDKKDDTFMQHVWH